ncbi:MAG: ATP synthase F1 subunit delta [Chloroflexota bacterium]
MSTSEAQAGARALYDSLITSALQALRVVETSLKGTNNNNQIEKRLKDVLPPDTPTQVYNFVLALAKEGQLDQISNIVQSFESFTQADGEKALIGEVTSAVELEAKQREQIETDLRSRYSEHLELQFRIDPSIIGGLIIRIGDQVLDNSLRSRLSAVQRNMLSS